jgi:magnesium-transporting ATPase (P-type)
MDTLVVVGRADPIDKQMICAGLQAMQKKVAVIGEGLNDIQAFDIADVSFAMGSGASITRSKASMVLLDNNFDSCVKAILRGRNIYANIKRFLQFQITVNFSCLFVILFGLIYLTESPFNAVQLIWINLIMDVLGALALATAAPLPSVIHQPAVTHDTPILQKVIWRQVYGVTLWNIIVMVLVMYFGRSMFNLPYQSSDQVADTPNKQQHFTIIFNTFVFLQFFNQINCRVVGPTDFNVFAGFFSNWIFILVLAVIYFVQLWASSPNGLGWLFETCAIESQDFYSSIVWGSTSLLVAFLLKLTPAEWMEKVPIKIDENEALGADSKIMGTYQQQKQLNVRELAQKRSAANDDDYEKVESE